ncbi:amidase family protein [Phytohabitans sp. LJ34]|uniref:amidase family protein n=1 Tax=Phytohabitans sp. LJ34 TaxID=3452217 RepID=UPI003F8B1B82
MRRLNPPINAVVTIDAERARRDAAAADEALMRGTPLGPLHGLPMTTEDTLEVAGMRTTSGAEELADHRRPEPGGRLLPGPHRRARQRPARRRTRAGGQPA